MFYNVSIATTCGVIGGVCMYEKEDYRKMAIEMIEKIERLDVLSYLHTFIKLFLEEWG